MAKALVNQRSKSYPMRIDDVGSRNWFDLSHDVKMTTTMGKLTPTLVLETLPNDEFKIGGEFMMRFAPLYLPIMHRVNMECAYFYVPDRVLWPKDEGDPDLGFQNFIFQIPTSSQVHPYVDHIPASTEINGGITGELPSYMGFPTKILAMGVVATFQINAFPISAYYATWDQYYRNDQIQAQIWIPLVSGDNSANMPEPYGAGSYLCCMYRNWNYDLFTSSTVFPQAGSDVQLPIVDSDLLPGGATSYLPTQWKALTTGADAPSGDLVTNASGESLVSIIPVGLDIQETASTIAQVRQAFMLQEWLERSLRAGDRYSDRMMTFFKTDPLKGVIQVPEFIGRKTGRVVISEVMSTTETATLKVGSYAGQAIALESTDNKLSYYCKEHGIILGIFSVYPDSSYFQGIERMWSRSIPLDYAWEQFALIGDQEVLNKEVNADLKNVPTDPDYNDDVFGYNRRYYEWTYKNDIVAGQMRENLISFHLARLFDQADPTTTLLNSAFMQCRPDITRVFQVVEGEDEIYAHIYNDVQVNRRLPKYGIPAI